MRDGTIAHRLRLPSLSNCVGAKRRKAWCSTGIGQVQRYVRAGSMYLSSAPHQKAVGSAVVVRFFVCLQVSAQSRCGKRRRSLHWQRTHQKVMGSAVVVHLLVSLQGQPPDLATKKEVQPRRIEITWQRTNQKAVGSAVVVRLFVSSQDETDLHAKKEGATQLDRCSSVASTLEGDGVSRLFVNLQGGKISIRKKAQPSWIGIAWQRTHQNAVGTRLCFVSLSACRSGARARCGKRRCSALCQLDRCSIGAQTSEGGGQWSWSASSSACKAVARSR